MNKETLIQVQNKVKPYIHTTPVLTSELINKICSCIAYFKCENFQKAGAFKIRGAVNAILNLTDEERNKGVVTHSSGNFAQALSLAAKIIGVKAFIVMPDNVPQVKKYAVKYYAGEIFECASKPMAREEMAEEV